MFTYCLNDLSRINVFLKTILEENCFNFSYHRKYAVSCRIGCLIGRYIKRDGNINNNTTDEAGNHPYLLHIPVEMRCLEGGLSSATVNKQLVSQDFHHIAQLSTAKPNYCTKPHTRP